MQSKNILLPSIPTSTMKVVNYKTLYEYCLLLLLWPKNLHGINLNKPPASRFPSHQVLDLNEYSGNILPHLISLQISSNDINGSFSFFQNKLTLTLFQLSQRLHYFQFTALQSQQTIHPCFPGVSIHPMVVLPSPPSLDSRVHHCNLSLYLLPQHTRVLLLLLSCSPNLKHVFSLFLHLDSQNWGQGDKRQTGSVLSE